MYLIMLLALTIPLIFMFLSHPVSLSIMIFLQVILISLVCGLISNLFWFSYMLFMVMIGGLLVLFMYMTNVASNEKFKPSKTVKIIVMLMITVNFPLLMLDKFYSYSINSLWLHDYNKNWMNMILMKYYNYPAMNIMIMMMIYLLLTMIMTVKMTDIKEGALRQKI